MRDVSIILFCVAIGALMALGVATLVRADDARAAYDQLAYENHKLRMAEARRARFKDLEAGAPADVNVRAAQAASFDMGTPQSILVAVRQFERGPEGYELGNKAKTEFFVRNLPMDHWQYYEASRTLNRIVWKHALADPERRRQLFKALSEYTRKDHAKDWAKGVELFERRAAGK